MKRGTWAAGFVVVCVGTAWALSPGDGVLGGPSVAGEPEEATLVERGFNGEVLPLDAPPAIAAIDLLELDEETEQALHALLSERARIMDGIVLSNIELLTEIETVMSVGRPVEKLSVIRRGLAALEPARAWGRLEDRLAEALPGPQRARYLALVEEYEEAAFAHAVASGDVEHRFEHRMARYWADMTWEIERSAERVFDDEEGDAWLTRLSEKLDLTPEQEGEIRARAERFFIETGGRPTEAQELEFISEIRTVMTVEQRWRFTAMMLRGELEPGGGDE
jgi:hypothetical protein